MTVNELYDEITKHMTPDQALRKLLEGAVIQYENIQFKEESTPVHPLFVITMAAMDMGWQLAVENNDGNVQGLVVGTEEYMKKIFKE